MYCFGEVLVGADFHRVQRLWATNELRAKGKLLMKSKCGQGEGRVLFFCQVDTTSSTEPTKKTREKLGKENDNRLVISL